MAKSSKIIVFSFLLLACTLLLKTVQSSGKLRTSRIHVVGNENANKRFYFNGTQFILDGKPFYLIAGEIHYSRIPEEYWRQRIQMVRALGCNTLSVYIMWNFHEIWPGQFDFTSYMKNLQLFLQIAQEENMWVLIRPGPYVCAEWDFGGQPYWLLRDKSELRTTNPNYVNPSRRYVQRVAKELKNYQIEQGGPIIMLQIENEYGFYGTNNTWPILLKQLWDETGIIKIPYYTADPSKGLKVGYVPDAAIGVNGGTTAADWKRKNQLNSSLPGLSAETYPGWLTHWTEGWAGKSIKDAVSEIEFLLSNNYSFSIYMAHGGTNFGFWAGSNDNLDQKVYLPDITSYDYDAPINEMGWVTEKFWAMRATIQKYLPYNIPAVPAQIPNMTVPVFSTIVTGSIFDNLPKPVYNQNPLTFEILNQKFGLVLYEALVPFTALKPDQSPNELQIDELHDYAAIYIDGKYVNTLYRGDTPQPKLQFNAPGTGPVKLRILVEAMGRVNFDHAMQDDSKGITHSVKVNGKTILGWQMYSLPLNGTIGGKTPSSTPGLFFQGQFTVTGDQNVPVPDTYLDMSAWQKGFLWVNGKNLGRFWNVGPQQRLYCPGVWLKRGLNIVQVFDFKTTKPQNIQGFQHLIGAASPKSEKIDQSATIFASQE